MTVRRTTPPPPPTLTTPTLPPKGTPTRRPSPTPPRAWAAPTTPYDHDGNDRTSQVTGCVGYELTGNLNFSGSQWASGRGDNKGWDPIGIYTGTGGFPYGSPFTVVFDGNNHTISNLYINRPEEEGVGLFGNVGTYYSGDSSEIRNVQLRDVSVEGSESVGALVGTSSGAISSSSVTGGTVTGVVRQDEDGNDVGGAEVGGLVGTSSGEISDSAAAVTVTGRGQVGGLVGHSLDPITNSHASGDVSGKADVGGLVGRNDDDITRSYATGDVTGTGTTGASAIGGLVGTHWYDSSTISNSYAEGHVTGTTFVGGLVGLAWGGDIQTSYATGNVTGENRAESRSSTVDPSRPDWRAGRGEPRCDDQHQLCQRRRDRHASRRRGWSGRTSALALFALPMPTATWTVIPGGEGRRSCQSDRDPGCRIGGLVGTNVNGGAVINSYAIGQLFVEPNHNRVGGLAGESPTERLWAFVGYVDPGSITGSYWDTETSEIAVGVGTDDENNNRVD